LGRGGAQCPEKGGKKEGWSCCFKERITFFMESYPSHRKEKRGKGNPPHSMGEERTPIGCAGGRTLQKKRGRGYKLTPYHQNVHNKKTKKMLLSLARGGGKGRIPATKKQHHSGEEKRGKNQLHLTHNQKNLKTQLSTDKGGGGGGN